MALILIIAVGVKTVSNKEMRSIEKTNQFECGFNVIAPPHVPFSFQFFLVAILFLIFDIEISLVMSFPLEQKKMQRIICVSFFLIILLVGLVYE